MAGPSRTSLVSVEVVAVLTGAICLMAVLGTAIAAGGRAAVPGLDGPEAAVAAWIVVGLGVLGFLALVVSTRWPDRSSDARDPRARDRVLEESEIRSVLEQWHPDWEARHRSRVATAIAYHDRRMGFDE